MADYDITSDSQLEAAVRQLTDYGTDILTDDEISGIIDSAKRILATELDQAPNFYNDRGLTLALVGVTCIEAKVAVENEAVASYDLGQGVRVEARDGDGNSLQVQRYEHRIRKGIKQSNVSTNSRVLGNTSSYIG